MTPHWLDHQLIQMPVPNFARPLEAVLPYVNDAEK